MNRHRAPCTLFAAFVLTAALVAMPPALGAGKTGALRQDRRTPARPAHSGKTGALRPATSERPDAPGDELWATLSAAGENPTALGASPDGSKVFVAGSTGLQGGPNIDYVTGALDAITGAKLWGRRYNGLGDGNDSANALGVSASGSTVFVTGGSVGSDGSPDFATVAYAASTGIKLWSRRYGPANSSNYAVALDVNLDGSTVFVTGSSSEPASFSGYVTIAYDAATGSTLWARRYESQGGASDPQAIRSSADGSTVFVTGRSQESGNYSDYATVAYDATTGSTLWVRRSRGPADADDQAAALGISPDGSKVFVTGTRARSASAHYATVAYDASDGTPLWAQRYDGEVQNSASALGVSPEGSTVFVTGYSGDTSHLRYATVAYDASTGEERWVTTYDGPENYSYASALGVSPDGTTVFVTGSSLGTSFTYSFATLGYDAATGAPLWEGRYDGPENESYATALEVSPDGSEIFVTGGTRDGSYYRVATVGYSNQ